MTRFHLVLLFVLIGSSLYMVEVAYEGRRLFATTEKTKAEASRLKNEEIRLLAEREEQATHLRIDKVARERLHMQPTTPAVSVYLNTTASEAIAP